MACHSTLIDQKTPLNKLGAAVHRLAGVKALSGRFHQVLEQAPGDALTKKVLADLDAATAAFEAADTEVDGVWAEYKKAREELHAQHKCIAKRVGYFKSVLIYRLSDEDVVRLKAALSAGRTRVGHHKGTAVAQKTETVPAQATKAA